MSYNHAFHNDLDGSFLQSLSLSDKQEPQKWDQNDDDLMEIDYDYDYEEQALEAREVSPEEDESEVHEIPETQIHSYPAEVSESHDSLVSNILSPTTLGAKLAIRPRLLLLPAPEKAQTSGTSTSLNRPRNSSQNDHESAYDHEYTLSSLPNIRHRNRNISSFQSRPDVSSFLEKEDEYVYNPSNGNYDQVESLSQNALTQSYSYRRSISPSPHQPSAPAAPSGLSGFQGFQGLGGTGQDVYGFQNRFAPVVQHHHHYYFGKEGTPVDSKENLSELQSDNMEIDQLEPYQRQGNNQVIQHNQNNSLAPWNSSYPDINQQIKLPNPWSPSSRPLSHLPYILSSYLQLAANAAVLGYAGYVVYLVVSSIREDVANKVSAQTAKLLVEIEICRRAYVENDCSPELVVPYLEQQCGLWEKCMNQDPTRKGNLSSISAETIGLLINSLVEPLGLKFFLVLMTFIVVVFGCNFTFGYVRAKMYYGWSESEQDSETPGL